jgi:hypothetical protein
VNSQLEGLLLSDGSISLPKSRSRGLRKLRTINARYQQTSATPEFLQWSAQWLPTTSKISGPNKVRVEDKFYKSWMLRSPADPAYTAMYHRWYPSGRKQLPPDLSLDSPLLLAAYLGDGCSGQTTKSVSLAMYGYTVEERQWLANSLRALGFEAVAQRSGSIEFKIRSMAAFLEFIGPCPVAAYSHKWHIPEHWSNAKTIKKRLARALQVGI